LLREVNICPVYVTTIHMLLNIQCDMEIYTLDQILINQQCRKFFYAAVDAILHLHNVSAFVNTVLYMVLVYHS